MNYCEIKNVDIANGEGIRVSLFVSGCRHHCKECFNQEAWNFNYGKKFTKETEKTILDMLNQSYIKGLTILGGEPFEPENQKCLVSFIRTFRKKFNDTKTIWIYSGFTFEELKNQIPSRCYIGDVTNTILSMIDVLVDGRFEIDKKDISLKFRGSKNQRIINLKKSLDSNQIVLLDM